MWNASIPAVHKYLADETRGQLWYGHADMNSGQRTFTIYGALDAFFPALLALSGDIDRARRLQRSSFAMWNLHHIEPEEIDYRLMRATALTYHLRPEIIESTYYLHHYTRRARVSADGRNHVQRLREILPHRYRLRRASERRSRKRNATKWKASSSLKPLNIFTSYSLHRRPSILIT